MVLVAQHCKRYGWLSTSVYNIRYAYAYVATTRRTHAAISSCEISNYATLTTRMYLYYIYIFVCVRVCVFAALPACGTHLLLHLLPHLVSAAAAFLRLRLRLCLCVCKLLNGV